MPLRGREAVRVDVPEEGQGLCGLEGESPLQLCRDEIDESLRESPPGFRVFGVDEGEEFADDLEDVVERLRFAQLAAETRKAPREQRGK